MQPDDIPTITDLPVPVHAVFPRASATMYPETCDAKVPGYMVRAPTGHQELGN